MAEAQDIQDKPLEELEREITCTVCQGHYQKPRLLPCNHYYCEACVEQLAKRSRGKPFDCPECRKETSLPAGGAAELQGAFFVERMKDVYYKMAKAEGKIEAVCEECGEGKAVAFCRKCARFICSDCERGHEKMKSFSGHILASLEDLKKGGINDMILQEDPTQKCAEHDQVIKLFCFDCNQLICGDCTIIDHSGHHFNFLKECAPESRKTLHDSLTSLQKVQADIVVAEKSLVSEEAKIDTQESDISKSIEQKFDKLKGLLRQRKAELMKRAATIAREKKDALSAQKKGFRVAQTEIQLLVDLIQRNIESTSDQDLMSIQTQLKAQIQEKEECHRQLPLELTATAGISCSLPSCDVIPDNLGLVFDQPRLPRLLNSKMLCEVSSTMDVRVFAPAVTPLDISAQLKCVANPSLSLRGEIIQKGVAIYSVNLTPQVRGRHDLTVRVKDQEITGSPFQVFVRISPSQLGQNVRKIGDITYTTGGGRECVD